MSVEIMSKVWKEAPYYGNTLLCLLACADWANDEGEFYPSYNTIGKKIRITRRSAIRILASLVEEGTISKVIRGDAKNHKSNLFKIHIEKFAEIGDRNVTATPKRAKGYKVEKTKNLVTPETLPSDTEDTTPSDLQDTTPSDSSVTHIHHVYPSNIYPSSTPVNLPKAENLLVASSEIPSQEIVEPIVENLANLSQVDQPKKPAAQPKAKAAGKPQADSGEGKASTLAPKMESSPVSGEMPSIVPTTEKPKSDHQKLLDLQVEITGQPIIHYAKFGKFAKEILAVGYTVEQVEEVLHWMANPQNKWWKSVDLQAVSGYIGEYFRRKTQLPPQEPKPNGFSTTKTRDFSRIIANLPDHLR